MWCVEVIFYIIPSTIRISGTQYLTPLVLQTGYPICASLLLFHLTIGQYLTDKTPYVEYTQEMKDRRLKLYFQRNNDKRPSL